MIALKSALKTLREVIHTAKVKRRERQFRIERCKRKHEKKAAKQRQDRTESVFNSI
jgi:hypothetical protein